MTVVANEHNHELIVSPSKTRFFRSHRNITNEQKELIHMLNEQNISTSHIMAFMQAREGGRHNIQFTHKDLSNKDFRTKDGEPTLWSDDPIEKDARRLYTRNIFSEFKTQLRATTSYKLIELENDSLYKISPISHPSSSRQRMCTYTVTVVRSENIVSCTCKLFEFYGLLCAHALKVMHYIEIYNIPSRYILKRWTNNAKKGLPSNSVEISGGSSFCNLEGSKSLKAFETACQIIRQGVDTLTSISQIFEIEEATLKEPSDDLQRIVISQSSQVNILTLECTIKDPPHSQCKGKRRPQRFKLTIEKKIIDKVPPNDQ
ncbi:Protein FAR1-RELATED SEQUENCE 7, partial [Ananas comosus]